MMTTEPTPKKPTTTPWDYFTKFPPWFVRLLARRKVRTKCVVAMGDEEIAIAAGMSVDRVRAIYNQRSWANVPLNEIRAFFAACQFDPFECTHRNRAYAYLAAVKSGRCSGYSYLKKSPWWKTTFEPLILKMKGGARG